jgi:hypothetical protein
MIASYVGLGAATLVAGLNGRILERRVNLNTISRRMWNFESNHSSSILSGARERLHSLRGDAMRSKKLSTILSAFVHLGDASSPSIYQDLPKDWNNAGDASKHGGQKESRATDPYEHREKPDQAKPRQRGDCP